MGLHSVKHLGSSLALLLNTKSTQGATWCDTEILILSSQTLEYRISTIHKSYFIKPENPISLADTIKVVC